MTEKEIGILLGFNGILIFIVEMPLIHYLEKKNSNSLYFVFIGAVFLLFSFLIYQIGHHSSLLWIGMVFMSIAEMIAFPFANSFALNRSKRGYTGQYMALFSIAFSIAHVFGHNIGFQLINKFSFETAWWWIILLGSIMTLLFFILKSNSKD